MSQVATEKIEETKEEGEGDHCLHPGCQTGFTFFTRKHHCRKCAKLVCDDCSTNRMKVKKSKKERVCDLCWFGHCAREGVLSEFMGNESRIRKIVNEFNYRGHTLVYVAARNGRLAIVQWLVTKGADVDLPCQGTGSTPLHGASFYGHKAVVRFLVTAECKKNVRNKYGHHPLEEGKTDEIKRCIRKPTRGDAGHFVVDKREIPSLKEASWTEAYIGNISFPEHLAYENRYKVVDHFTGLGDDFEQVYLHLKMKASLNDKTEWLKALVYVYTMETKLYGSMNKDLLVGNDLSEFRFYAFSLSYALRALKTGLPGQISPEYSPEDRLALEKEGFHQSVIAHPSMRVDESTILYRSARLTPDQVKCYERCVAKFIKIKSFTSTTKSESLCHAWNKKSGHNVIFEITLANSLVPCYDVSALSCLPHEEEVLIEHSALFRVEKVRKNPDKPNGWIFSLKLQDNGPHLEALVADNYDQMGFGTRLFCRAAVAMVKYIQINNIPK